MTAIQNMTRQIEAVAAATNSTKEQVAAKLIAKDDWTWFLISQS